MQHDNRLLKYILDIESAINDIDEIKIICDNRFDKFNDNFLTKHATERLLEIIGEAMNHIVKIHPGLKITGAKHIIGLRNLIIHSYDVVDPEILWGIIQTDIPVLKNELHLLRR